MATRRKKRRVSGTKTTPRRRRRAVTGARAVGAVGAVRRRRRKKIGAVDGMMDMAMDAAGLVTGAVAARELNTLINTTMTTSMSPIVSGVIQMGAGIALKMLVKNNKFVDNMGSGMIANGGMVVVVSSGLITGPQNPRRIQYRINGDSPALNLNAVNGLQSPNLKVVAGVNTRPRITPRLKTRNTY